MHPNLGVRSARPTSYASFDEACVCIMYYVLDLKIGSSTLRAGDRDGRIDRECVYRIDPVVCGHLKNFSKIRSTALLTACDSDPA